MAVAFQAASPVATGTGTSVTYAVTVSSGSDLALAVGVSLEYATFATEDVTGVTFNGVALTQVNADVLSGDAYTQVQMWRLVNPAVGTFNVVVSLTNASGGGVITGACSMTGVHQTTPVGTAVSQVSTSATSLSATVGSVGSDDLLVDALAADSNVTVTPGEASQTSRVTGSLAGKNTLGMSTRPGSAGAAMSWSWTGARPSCLLAVAFKPSAVAVVTNPAVLVADRLNVQHGRYRVVAF